MDAALIFDWAKAIAAVAAAVTVLAAAGRFIRVKWREAARAITKAVDALAKIEPMSQKIEDIQHQLHVAEAENRALSDSDPSIARFTCSQDGGNAHVNVTYCRWLNASREELLGWRWLSFVPEAERDRLREEWEAARAERRVYRLRHSLMTSDHRRIFVDVTITPVPDAGPVSKWIGVMRRVEPTT